MEFNYAKINEKIRKLIDLRLNKGVQPSELMENINNEEYSKVYARKIFGETHCTVGFTDYGIFDNIKSKYEYIYRYDNNMCLKEIIMKKNKLDTIIWNRQNEEIKILNEIIMELRNNSKTIEINKLIENLPNDLCEKFKERFELIEKSKDRKLV